MSRTDEAYDMYTYQSRRDLYGGCNIHDRIRDSIGMKLTTGEIALQAGVSLAGTHRARVYDCLTTPKIR